VRHGDHRVTPTVAGVVHRAVQVCDPVGTDERLDDFLRRFEDRDEPVTALGDERDDRFFQVAHELEGQGTEAALLMAAAVATYLAFRRDEVDDDDVDILRMAARAEFHGRPPVEVARWLDDQGIEA
jgi:hypothetical protein